MIRPIITYACPIWFNISADMMERLRVFERRCLRACLGTYKSADFNFQKYISNQTIYDKAMVNRIDNFIIKLTSNYYATLSNSELKLPLKPQAFSEPSYIDRVNDKGYLPPESFIRWDSLGLIQNKFMIPIFYHAPRRRSQRKLNYDTITLDNNSIPNYTYLKFNMSIPKRDPVDNHPNDTDKYWWLSKDSVELPINYANLQLTVAD